MAGSLFVVATPIGNLEDLSFRALRTLREVDLVAAEDTRRTARLLAHYEVRKPLTSYREHNEARETPRLVARMKAGESVALVSDAGTPGISDPGARLVRAALAEGLKVVPVPGPSAITAALSASGLPADQFLFMGFPPSSGASRQRWLNQLATEARTVVLFESPHRIDRTLDDIKACCGNRPIVLGHEISKIYESFVILPNKQAEHGKHAKGEFVVCVGPVSAETAQMEADPDEVVRVFEALLAGAVADTAQAEEMTARALGCSQRQVAKIVKKHKIKVKQQNP